MSLSILEHGPMNQEKYYRLIGNRELADNLLTSNILSIDPDTEKVTFQSEIVKVYIRRNLAEEACLNILRLEEEVKLGRGNKSIQDYEALKEELRRKKDYLQALKSQSEGLARSYDELSDQVKNQD